MAQLNDLLVLGNSNLLGDANIFGTLGIYDNLNIDGNVSINSTTDSTATTNGALIVKGGVGIAKQLRVAGNTTLSGTLSVTGTSSFHNLMTISHGDKKGIKLGGAYITCCVDTGEVVLQGGHLRFGPSDWNYNVWGGLACNGYGTIALGLADNVYFKANTVQTGGTLTLPGIHYLVINDKEALAAYDSWLRINEDLAFSSGIYFGTSLVRTDGQFQVGSGGSAFYANNSGNVYASNAIGAGGRIYTGYDSGVTNSISCSNWFRASGETGLYNASYGLHLMPNLISDYTGWRVSGVRGGYHGILVGDAKTSMAIMSIDNSHQGLYTQTGTGWIIYNKNDSGQIGIRTSTLTPEYNITLGGTTSIVGGLYMNNNNIIGVNNLQFSDPGVQEGITWADGNGWWIYESPDNLSNAAGNLQFVHGSTRRLTIRTDGYIDANAHLLANNGLTWTNAYWTAPGNITCVKNGTNVEFSFDMGAETQWHVWSTPNSASMLSCFSDSKYVQVHHHLQVGNYSNGSYALTTDSFICNSWIRTKGQTGWFNEDYGGGWYMTDTTYVRAYNNKQVYVSNAGQHAIYTAGGFASATTSGAVFSTYYNGTWYETLRTHGNGNLTVDAPGGSLYLAYYRGNTYFAGGTYYIDRNGHFNGGTAYLTRQSSTNAALNSAGADNLYSDGKLQWAAVNSETYGNDGSIISLGWNSSYGSQIWVDDGSGNGGMAVRSRTGSSWNPWKTLIRSNSATYYGTGNPPATGASAGDVYFKYI